jgi:hypothetical protein
VRYVNRYYKRLEFLTTHGQKRRTVMDEFEEWDEVWELTESGSALIDLIDRLKQDAEL